jgi:hypothetical protein
MTYHKAEDQKFDKEFSLPDEDYTLYMSDSTRQMFMPARLTLNISESRQVKIDVNKRSSGRTRSDAMRKAESIIYNSRISNDTIWLDDYFTLPSGSKWTADFLTINLFVPENTVLFFDRPSRNLFRNAVYIGKEEDGTITNMQYDTDTEPWQLADKYWVISEEGLKEKESSQK